MAKGFAETHAQCRDIVEDIRKGIFSPVYLLMGEEPYYPEQVYEAIVEHVLDDSERDFNQTVCYGTDTDAGSSYDVAKTLQIPVILVVPCRGAALSLAALVRGIIEFRSDSNIRGILLNRVSKMLYPRLKDMLEQELKKSGYDIPVVGYIPEDEAFRLESRHLGLVTPQELNDLKEQTERAGRILAESVDLDQILSVAQAAPELETKETRSVHPADGYGLAENGLTENSLMGDGCSVRDGKDRKEGQKRLRIGIARDEAFCFYYKLGAVVFVVTFIHHIHALTNCHIWTKPL